MPSAKIRAKNLVLIIVTIVLYNKIISRVKHQSFCLKFVIQNINSLAAILLV